MQSTYYILLKGLASAWIPISTSIIAEKMLHFIEKGLEVLQNKTQLQDFTGQFYYEEDGQILTLQMFVSKISDIITANDNVDKMYTQYQFVVSQFMVATALQDILNNKDSRLEI